MGLLETKWISYCNVSLKFTQSFQEDMSLIFKDLTVTSLRSSLKVCPEYFKNNRRI